jgi:hypothetical protein
MTGFPLMIKRKSDDADLIDPETDHPKKAA